MAADWKRFLQHIVISKLAALVLESVLAGMVLTSNAAQAEIIDLTCSPGNLRYVINTDNNNLLYLGKIYQNDQNSIQQDGRPIHIKFIHITENVIYIIVDHLDDGSHNQIEIYRDTEKYSNTMTTPQIADGRVTGEFRRTISGSCSSAKDE
jgi:hypothetical protein